MIHFPKFFGKLPLRSCLLGPAFLSLTLLPALAANWPVHVQPARIVNGSPILFQVKAPANVEALTGTWLGHSIVFTYNPSAKNWNAFAGVSIETVPGSYSLDLVAVRDTTKQPLTFSRKFSIVRASYPKIKVALAVDEKFTEPTPEQVKEIDEAKKVKEDYLNRTTADREWSGTFVSPADAGISDVFGSERIFNGKTSSPHLGLDFRVPSGTPVAAMNDGTVLLARPLYYEGNFVVLDHGQGLLTLYLHLSEFKVKEGDFVKRGQIIGLSGGTGRATGPHLHVAVRWQGTYLDPARMMQLHLPAGKYKPSAERARLTPGTSIRFAQSVVENVFQRQVPDQPMQIVGMYSQNFGSFHVVSFGLPDGFDD